MNRRFIFWLKNQGRALIILVVIFILSLIFYSRNRAFLTWSNITGIFSNYAVYGIMALGMMLVISTGNIDVSVGAQLATVSMLVGKLVKDNVISNPIIAFLICLLTGLIIGLFNGFLVAKIRIPAIIASLGTLNILRGALLLIVGSSWVSGLPDWFTSIARTNPLGIGFKTTAYSWLIVILAVYFLMYHTIAGRAVLAVGANQEGARRIGFVPSHSYLLAFGILGLTSGLGAFFYTSNIGMAQPVAGTGYEMTLIAIVVIGGTSFAGGKISVFGTFLGTFLIGVIENGMIMAKVPVYWQELIKGVVILLAIISSFFSITRTKKANHQMDEVAAS